MFVNEALMVLASVVRTDTLRDVHSATLLGVIADESMDNANQSQLLVYYKLCVRGRAKTPFAGVERLTRGTSGVVTSPIRSRMRKDGVRDLQMGAVGLDGCSAMFGKKNGVALRLICRNKICVGNHCICHRGALGCKDAAEDVDYMRIIFFPIVEHLGRFYDNSAVRTASFQRAQSEEHVSELKLLKSAFTRWLSHDAVTHVLYIRFIPLCKDLRSYEADPTAAGLFFVVCTREFIGTLSYLRDTLPLLARLNRLSQSHDVDMTVLESTLPIIIQCLEQQVDEPGEHFARREKFVQRCLDAGLEVRNASGRTERWLEVNRRQYLMSLRDNLLSRFPSIPLMSALYQLFNPHGYPRTLEQLRHFGDNQLRMVCEHYSQVTFN
jgi:hypothetical protein